jgi:hypothetical protein
LVLLGRIWNRAAAWWFNGVERFMRFPTKPREDSHRQDGGASYAGTAVHANKSAFQHKLNHEVKRLAKTATCPGARSGQG